MKHILSMLFISALSFSEIIQAQSVSDAEMRANGEVSEEFGYVAKSLESLVGTPSLIVKGRFGDHIINRLHWGEADDRESLRAEGLTDREIDDSGILTSDYEIIIDEVLLGSVTTDKIIYRIWESPPLDRRFTHPSIERIFFLFGDGDGIYSPGGPASVLNLRDGEYTFDSLADRPNIISGEHLEFIIDSTAAAFETVLMKAIEVENGKAVNTLEVIPDGTRIDY